MTTGSDNRRRRSGIRLPLWVLIPVAIAMLIVVFVGAFGLFRLVRDWAAGGLPPPVVTGPTLAVESQDTIVEESQEGVVQEPLPQLAPEDVAPWSGQERINFLLMGVDQRCDEEGPTHTDSIMVGSVDPMTMSAAILSLPRDLWVDIPGFGLDRINQAYYFGRIYEYPGGGQALAMETVEGLLGIPIDYYITANFNGFVQAVDQIGGITIEVPEAIDDPDYPDNCYGYDPFSIESGPQRLDGETALKYARTRATFGGDVDRAGRQQAVVMAVRQQVTQLNQVPQLIVQAPQLWRTFRENVNTNLSLEDAVQLALLAQDIPQEKIQSAVLDYDYVFNATTPDGRQVLIPRRDEIRGLRNQLFALPVAPTPVIENLPQRMEEEGARVALWNGTSVFGLAADTQRYLQDLGVEVTEIDNADSGAYETTRLIDYGDNPQTVQFLIQEMGVLPLNVEQADDAGLDYDILVIMGHDWATILQEE